MAKVFLNGRILPETEACIPVNDRAILFGDGAYETMRSYARRFFRFPEHLRRLQHTLRGMSLELPYTDEQITRGALDLLEANGLEEARLRLTVTGGAHDGQIRLRRSHAPNLILTAEPLVPPPAEKYADGVSVILSRWPVHSDSPLPRIKTVTRLMHLMAKEEALERGAWEAVFCDETGGLLEGTATNVFFVIDGALCTAGLDGPLLAGVTRDAVLEVARDLGVAVREDCVRADGLDRLDEAFLTSTTIELLPVREIDGRPVGAGRPGPVWRRLLEGYRELVSRETGVNLSPLP